MSRVGLIDGQGVEEVRVPGLVGDVGQTDVVVVQQRGLVLLDGVEKLRDGGMVIDGDHDGHGVDEEPDHLVGTVEVGGATRHGLAERDAALSCHPGQEDRPRSLDDRGHRDTTITGQRL